MLKENHTAYCQTHIHRMGARKTFKTNIILVYCIAVSYGKLGVFWGRICYWVCAAKKFQRVPWNLPLILLNRSEIIREVLGTCVGNDTMLRQSDQLLLAPENHHFEGSMHLKAERRYCVEIWSGVGHFFRFQKRCQSKNRDIIPSFCLEVHATFKVMVLRRQDELVGPPRHSIIRNACSHDSPASFRAFEQLWRRFIPLSPKIYPCCDSVENPASEYDELTIWTLCSHCRRQPC